MKIIENTKEKLSFTIEGNESLANAIRRSVLEIPVLAIDEVEFYKNDGVLYDEMLALRLGLVPLKNEDLDFVEDCKCKGKGCSNCNISLKLEAKGPITVTSGMLKGKAGVVYEEIPITELEKDQEISLTAKAIVGKATQHAKFSPGLVYYSFTPIIEKVSDVKGKKIIEVSEKEFSEIKKLDKIARDYLDENVKCGNELIYVKANKEEILFTIESWGQITPKEIFLKAINVLEKNLKEIAK